MQVIIDDHSGFCFGVSYAIGVAERELHENPSLFCLGDIVHNETEVARLAGMGLKIISHADLSSLHDCKVMIRAHGEPPETYRTAFHNNIELIDASCPIVLNLQHSVYQGYLEMKEKNGQVVIYGKAGHAEVNGLAGQTDGTAIVVAGEKELSLIDFSRPVRCYSQTTMAVDGYYDLVEMIRQRMAEAANGKVVDFDWNDSICRQVSNRTTHLREFAGKCDVVVFVGGRKSSNAMILFKVVSGTNPNSYLVSEASEIREGWFKDARLAGVCGATSTPVWLMEQIADKIRETGN
ncbi:MAG: 4-hydroxy-3-methylbut-2-enyl diphosphate reductase [Bacteroidota bacterium]